MEKDSAVTSRKLPFAMLHMDITGDVGCVCIMAAGVLAGMPSKYALLTCSRLQNRLARLSSTPGTEVSRATSGEHLWSGSWGVEVCSIGWERVCLGESLLGPANVLV